MIDHEPKTHIGPKKQARMVAIAAEIEVLYAEYETVTSGHRVPIRHMTSTGTLTEVGMTECAKRMRRTEAEFFANLESWGVWNAARAALMESNLVLAIVRIAHISNMHHYVVVSGWPQFTSYDERWAALNAAPYIVPHERNAMIADSNPLGYEPGYALVIAAAQ